MTETTASLAVMFADIAQSTSLYDKIGDAAAHALISACIAAMTEVCVSHRGTIVKTIGDEIMCIFPMAEDAVGAAMTLQSAIDHIHAPEVSGCSTPDIYVGIDYGPVILENGDVFGDVVNVAARMVKLAKRRQVITTHEVIEALPPRFSDNCRCIDSVLVKGKSEEQQVYEIVWEKENITVALKSSGEGKSQIRQRLELHFAQKAFEVSDCHPAISIGRLDHNDIVVDDTRVSRFHARVEYRKGRFFLVDQSTNGTYITTDGSEAVLVLHDEMQLNDSGTIDLCCEEPANPSSIAILFKISYYKAVEPPIAAGASNSIDA